MFFYQSSAELLNESFDQLDLIFNFLYENENLIIFLEGHTDNIGNAKKNLELSRTVLPWDIRLLDTFNDLKGKVIICKNIINN